ncbi:MAG TPA: AAC(3) family N-acetyltransferase [Phycisphaerae bacterium]|nr:AAC(3) family N-acetyltransferase [Phycisphaerae bacterium]
MTPLPDGPIVTREQIAAGLRALGLSGGAGVMVHSSLRSFGRVVGGAEAVIGAIQDVLTPAGTLLMPAFNHGRACRDGGHFDPRATATTNGKIPDTFWRRPDVYRSLNPTHSFAAWGRHALRYVRHHHRTLTCGPCSPLGLLWRDGGSGLLLGVDYNSNTFHHVVETATGAPCLGRRTEKMPVRLNGRIVEGRTWGWRSNGCPITDGKRYGPLMASRGLDRRARIGNCTAVLFALDDCFRLIAELLRSGTDGCPPCRLCQTRPGLNGHSVASDWDERTQTPRRDSTAWRY